MSNIELNPIFESDKINQKLATSPWSTNRVFVYNLVKIIKPKKILELGTHYRCSLFTFLQSVKDNHIDTKIYAIDTWEGDPITGIYDGEEILNLVKTIISKSFKMITINLVQKSFLDAIKDFKDNSIDMIHIDGNHSYESVKEDFESWLPKLKKNGIILMHDVGNNAKFNRYGSHKYWLEINKKYLNIEQKHGWGLGLVFPKGNLNYKKTLEMNIPFFEEYQLNKLFKIQNDDLTKMVKERDLYIKKLEKIINKNTDNIDNKELYKIKNDKIAILLGSPDISGGTYVIFQHALALQNSGQDVTIITKESFDYKILDWFPKAKELKFIDLESGSKEHYKLCIATWWKTVFYLPKINATKFVYFVQSIESRFCPESEELLKEFIESTYSIPFYFITEAHWIQKYLKENYNHKSGIVLNGIDKNYFNTNGKTIDTTRANGPRVLVEGALKVFFKQTELAVEVAKNAGVKDIWLLTPTKIEKFSGISRIFSKIPSSQVGEVMRSCDIILKLSKVEGMFGPPLEMMHCGGTTVTFNVTGYDEYIKDGVNGLVYQMDDFKSITEGLSKLIKDPEYLEKLKQNGLITAKKWPDWNISGKNFVKEIKTIMEDKKIQPIDIIKTNIKYLENIYLKENNKTNSIKKILKLLFKKIYQKLIN